MHSDLMKRNRALIGFDLTREITESTNCFNGSGKAFLILSHSCVSIKDNPMLEFGIIGSENSHCANIARLCNIDQQAEARVTHVWGETPEFAKKAAEAGAIPTIVEDWKEMLGKVKGVMIDHRHAMPHFEVAKFFITNGVPCFVDKPFTFTLEQAKVLSDLAKEKNVPITSMSIIPLQQNFLENMKKVREMGQLANVITAGPVDLKSPYGGIFFYGIHQVDAVMDLVGTQIEQVEVIAHGTGGAAILQAANGVTITMNFFNSGHFGFHFAAVTDKGYHAWSHAMDEKPFLAGSKFFIEMFRTGKEPFAHERFLAPIAVLEAMAQSLQQGGRVHVAKVS